FLDLDDFGTQPCQEGGAVRASDGLREVDHSDPGEGAARVCHASRGMTRSAKSRRLRLACSAGMPPKFIHNMTCWTPVTSPKRCSSSTARDGSPKRATLSRYQS